MSRVDQPRRTIKIRVVARNGQDAAEDLRAIHRTFRSAQIDSEVEIKNVGSPEGSSGSSVADEPLETQASAAIHEELEERDRQALAKAQADLEGEKRSAKAHRRRELREARRRLKRSRRMRRLAKWFATAGWCVRLLETVSKATHSGD